MHIAYYITYTYCHPNNQQNDKHFLSYIDNAVAYVNATGMYGDDVKEHRNKIISQADKSEPESSSDDAVVAGYKAIYNTTATRIFNSPIGQVEILFMNSDPSGDIGITAALQHPYSHGRVYINSSNPMDYPVIDPNYLAHPAGMSLVVVILGYPMHQHLGHIEAHDTNTSPTNRHANPRRRPKNDPQPLQNKPTQGHPHGRNRTRPVHGHRREMGRLGPQIREHQLPPILDLRNAAP